MAASMAGLAPSLSSVQSPCTSHQRPFIFSAPVSLHLSVSPSYTYLQLRPCNLTRSTSGPPSRRYGSHLIHCSVAEQDIQVETAAETGTIPEGDGEVAGNDGAATVDLTGITEWELDFCSRPIMDERGKKVWELLVCDSTRRLEHSQYFPSNKINSATLRDALNTLMDERGLPKPQKVRFFRAQMQTIISKACVELDIRPIPSQRCGALVQWLEERFENIYSVHPRFQPGATPLLQLDPPTAQDLPDSLRGDQWAFVQLPLSEVMEELEHVRAGDVFGSSLDLTAGGLQDLPPDTLIPGIAVASTRATPLAAWTSALELAHLRVDSPRACVVLSTGVMDKWRYAFYRRSKAADMEGLAWEEAKKGCLGLHFLAVQKDLEMEECMGFWLMRDLPPPQI